LSDKEKLLIPIFPLLIILVPIAFADEPTYEQAIAARILKVDHLDRVFQDVFDYDSNSFFSGPKVIFVSPGMKSLQPRGPSILDSGSTFTINDTRGITSKLIGAKTPKVYGTGTGIVCGDKLCMPHPFGSEFDELRKKIKLDNTAEAMMILYEISRELATKYPNQSVQLQGHLLAVMMPTAMAETVDFENCQGFLSDLEIKNTLQYNGDLEITSRSATQTAKEETMHLRTMCTLTASTPDKSAAISMGVVVFSGSSPALKQYAMILDSAKNQNVEIYEGKNPWKFFSAELNQGGIGKTVVSQRDVYVLSFHTVESKTSESLASEESLQNLSLLVQQKIIPLAPGSYTPPSSPKVKPEVKEDFALIPSWIKNNALWWSDGLIGDQDFVSGIQYLIDKGIMKVPKPASTSEPALPFLPNWIKDTAGWWGQNKVTDSDFVNGIKWLIEHGIIKV